MISNIPHRWVNDTRSYPSRSEIIANYPKSKDKSNKDKQIRSIFIGRFSELFASYRSCLLITLINPKLFILLCPFKKEIVVSFE